MNPNKIICLSMAILLSPLAHCEVPQIEREALVSLYQHTGGENWVDNSNWLQGDPCDNNWFGIRCRDGEIAFLELIENNLTGSIPLEIGNFSQIIELSLNGNNLVGSIPEEIGSLNTLTRLSFGAIEAMIPKRRILELYLNVVEFGDGVYGAESAAQSIFNIPAKSLSVLQSALLAARLPAPKTYAIRPPSDHMQQRARWIQQQIKHLGDKPYLDEL